MNDLPMEFERVFQNGLEPRCFFAPGRVNLIGEHTDYNGGHVFPVAISLGTYALATKRKDNQIRMFSLNFPEQGIIKFDLSHLSYEAEHHWGNYPKGIIQHINRATKGINEGMDILYYGDIPNGAGLSSSASIEIVTGVLLHHLFSLEVGRFELAQLGQKVENEYLGINSGIMDQFAVIMGKKNKAIYLNTVTLEHTYATFHLKSHSLIIINSNKSRTLVTSAYNTRRNQCAQALKELQDKLDIHHLCDVTTNIFEQNKHLIKNGVIRRRARHVIEENERTEQAFMELQANNLHRFGKLMNDSHVSLRDNFEVTGKELDTIVEAAWKQPGVIGARITGAGFGGCAIAIVENGFIEMFKENVAQTYMQKIGYEPHFFTPFIVDGAREIDLTAEGSHT